MLKLGFIGLMTVAVSCSLFWGYDWYVNQPAKPAAETPLSGFSPVKTDFISVAVFDSQQVVGYVTFRAVVELKNEGLIAEAGYVIADLLHRKLAAFSKVFGGKADRKSFSTFEAPLLEALKSRLGQEDIGSVKLTDFAYDRRL